VVYKNMTNSIIAALAQRIPELEAIVGRALLMLCWGIGDHVCSPRAIIL